jgi:hypothetical protein
MEFVMEDRPVTLVESELSEEARFGAADAVFESK